MCKPKVVPLGGDEREKIQATTPKLNKRQKSQPLKQ